MEPLRELPITAVLDFVADNLGLRVIDILASSNGEIAPVQKLRPVLGASRRTATSPPGSA